MQLALVFLPGLIWAQIDASYAAKVNQGQVKFILKVFLFGLFTHLISFVGYRLVGKEFSGLDIDATNRTLLLLDSFVDEIAISTLLSLVLAVVWLYLANYKIPVRALNWIRATNRFGDEDVWDFTFSSSQPDVQYVHVRDLDKGIIYGGWVRAFSETGELRELLLRDAIVYDFQKREIQVPLLYLARDRHNIHIEFPYRKKNRSEEEEAQNGKGS